MKLRGVEFGPVLDASGARGFFGEGYPYHALWKYAGLDFTGSTFVAKTITLVPRKGNMHVRRDGTTPVWRLKPQCIAVNFRKGAVLNAVGLSNPGAQRLFNRGEWQKQEKPFFLSFMAVAPTARARLEELRSFVKMLLFYLPEFRARIGLQINYSCPNAGLHVEELAADVTEGLSVAAELGIPLMPKFNALFPVDVLANIAKHPACDELCMSNTIPWGAVPDRIDWKGLFGSETSPLEKFGGGGLSGSPITSIGIACVERMRASGITKPIHVGGGILRWQDVDQYIRAGASSIFIGSIALVRPWRMRKTIARAHEALYFAQ